MVYLSELGRGLSATEILSQARFNKKDANFIRCFLLLWISNDIILIPTSQFHMIVVKTRVSSTNPITVQFYREIHPSAFCVASFSFWSAGVASSRTSLFPKQKMFNVVAEILLGMLNMYKLGVRGELDN